MNHEEPDRVPTFTQSIESKFVRRYDEQVEIKGIPMLPQIDLQVAYELGFDSKWVHIGSSKPPKEKPEIPEELKVKEGQRVNNSGHVHQSDSLGRTWYVDGILKTPQMIRDWISFIDDMEPADASFYKSFKNTWDISCENGLVPIPTAGGPTYVTWASIGMDRFGYMLRKYPELVKRLHTAWTDLAIKQHKCIFEQGVDMCFICDDHAFKDRIMMHPRQFDQLVTPNFKRLADNAHQYGAKFILHTDGNIWEEMDCLINAGVDAAEPLEYESGMRLKPLKEKYGDKITLIGNVAASDVLSFGTVEETIKATKKCILDAAEGGGYILSPGANIIDTVKVENVQAMIETVKKYGIYPIEKTQLL